jgi:3-oxoacyl-[acyl-carrier-protein] synthase-3
MSDLIIVGHDDTRHGVSVDGVHPAGEARHAWRDRRSTCRPVCSGFVYALAVADRMVAGGMARNALVVGAEIYSRILDWNDRGTCVLFGDGAGAVVLLPSRVPGILSAHLHADGAHRGILCVPGTVNAGEIAGSPFVKMDGPAVFKFAVNVMAQVAKEALVANGVDASAIDWLIPHQANIRIIDATAKKLHIPARRR